MNQQRTTSEPVHQSDSPKVRAPDRSDADVADVADVADAVATHTQSYLTPLTRIT